MFELQLPLMHCAAAWHALPSASGATQVPAEHELLASLQAVPDAQQGCWTPPHATHWLLAHVIPVAHEAPLVQQGCPEPPHAAHIVPAHCKPDPHVLPQHGWLA